jgi:hypothetical protein
MSLKERLMAGRSSRFQCLCQPWRGLECWPPCQRSAAADSLSGM